MLQGSSTIVDLADLVSKIRERKPIPANAVALTFDDGYRDNYEVAFPILQKYGVPATIFLTTSFIDQKEVPWNDKVTFALKHTAHNALTFKYHDQEFSYPLVDIADRLKARDQVLWLLRHVAHDDKVRLVDEITRSLSVTNFDYLWKSMLTWDQVREMHHRGIGLGAHTITHPILTRLPLDKARHEIEGSKRAIESAISAPIQLFAYPAGTRADVSDAIKEAVRQSGFQGAVTTIFGFNSPETDPYSLSRGGSADPDETLFALQQAYYKLVN
jgi:peptidoglycan/xylan/chitin deacetylase (PgdA/CDA1 family)